MSEHIPLDSLQFVAQAAPQALNPSTGNAASSVADFKKLLENQKVVSSLADDTGQFSSLEALAGQDPPLSNLFPSFTTGNQPGGNVLPVEGKPLRLQQGGQVLSRLLSQSLPPTSSLPASTLDPVEATSELIGRQTDQSQTAGRYAGQLPVDTVLSAASRHLSTAAQPVQSATGLPIASEQSYGESPRLENLLHSLVSNQQQSLQSSDGRTGFLQIDQAQQHQATQQLTAAPTQPQSSVVTYNVVAQPVTTPPPPESGLLSGQAFQSLDIDVPVQSADWNRAFAERAVLLVNNQQSAQLRLNPASLGQIDIQVQVNDDDASIIFNTQSSLVKETVEAALPRLRDMLESQGLNLVDVNVNEQQTSEHDNLASAFDDNAGIDSEDAGLEQIDQATTPPAIVMTREAIDLYV